MVERCLVLALIVQDVGEVDARLGVVAVELERAPERSDRRLVVAQSMLCIANAGNGFRRIRRLLDGRVEKLTGALEERRPVPQGCLTEQRTANLKHQVGIVRVAKLEGAPEAPL